jgi:hypothetical protein
MDWRTTYPSIEALGLANFETLNTWVENLPDPQTDVQRTVWRRLGTARQEAMVKELRKASPEVADKYEDVIERFRALIKKA